MGVVNVTPDSFSDGGLWADPKVAIRHSWDLLAQGADILDIGGESTRPGTERTSEADEIARVVPVVKALANRDGAPWEGLQGTDPHVASEWDPDRPLSISVDTMRSRVAQEAIDAGATIINDVSGGLTDPRILDVVASAGVDYVLMHWRGQSATMQSHVHYDDPVEDVITELSARVDAAVAAGVALERIIVDPGIGFAKTGEQNWELVRHADRVQQAFADLRVLWGVSRKRFLGTLLAHGDQLRPAQERDAATAAITAHCALHRAWAVRTHEVRANRDTCETVAKILEPWAASAASRC